MTEPDAVPAIDQIPVWFAHQLDPDTDRLTLLRMDEAAYRAASFLDQRVLEPQSELRSLDWADAASAFPAAARRDAQYIFHIGNVGSTLVSRLLGELDGVFALREPLLLRTLYEEIGPLATEPRWPEGEAAARIDTLTALLSRTFRPEQRALVKATSFTSEIAWRLVPPGSNALFLYAHPQHYIENILAGQNSAQTLELLSPLRLARLRRRCPGVELDLGAAAEATKAALGWACEMTSLEESAARLPANAAKWLDFDLFLAAPERHLQAIAAHFGSKVDAPTAAQICGGPLMRRYSKALEYEFGPEMRREILAEARWRHGPAIREALRWLNSLAARYPAVAQAIRRAQQER